MKKILRYLIPFLFSALLIWWLFRKVDFYKVMAIIRGEVDYRWLLLVMAIVVLSHCIRGIRWGYQLRAAGVGDVPPMALCCSIFGAYSLNLLVPYLGEAWRIVYISKRQKAPLSTVVGTDVGDRISDAIVVVLLLCLSLAVGHSYIISFIERYSVGKRLLEIVSDVWLWLGFTGTVAVIATALYFLRNNGHVKALFGSCRRVWKGFVILFTMKGRWAYLWLTLGIWICYYLETYIAFFAFPYTRALITDPHLGFGLLPGLIAFVFGSMSIAVPSNGGLGPWNFAVMFALSLFGVSDADGTAFSLVVWSTVSITLVILGIYTLCYVAVSGKRHQSNP
ncbi:MAG: flippase-like domain-containing protein [Muribaculaceae bacterium]|nr:flippase-like domain-containing protein [Muribaculaceae bacterium]